MSVLPWGGAKLRLSDTRNAASCQVTLREFAPAVVRPTVGQSSTMTRLGPSCPPPIVDLTVEVIAWFNEGDHE